MRERVLSSSLPPRPRGIAELQTEARDLAHALRQGHDEVGVRGFLAWNAQVGPALAVSARQGGPTQPVQEVLGALQEASRRQAQKDLIAMADVLEHRLAPALGRMLGG